MDCKQVGNLIFSLRKEKGLTQKQLADSMNISDKTISKWERGLGCPDISILAELSEILGINIEAILKGDLQPSVEDGGNMKRIKFYICPSCGGVSNSTGNVEISCCGRKLEAMKQYSADKEHQIAVEEIENEVYITFSHDMAKNHYISFVAFVSYDSLELVKLYPEQGGEVRLPKPRRGRLYLGCSKHGLMKVN